MKNEPRSIALVCLAVIAGIGALTAGCGERQESTSYYYRPSWTRGGSVVLIKGLQTVRKDAIGTELGSSYTETLITSDAAGASESALLDATDSLPYAVSAAPAGDYLVYLDGTSLRGTLFSRAIVVSIAGGSNTRMEKSEFTFSPGIKAIDWNNLGTKLVYCTSTEVRTINLDGTGDTAIVTGGTGISFVTWKYGAQVAYVHTVAAVPTLSLLNGDGTGTATNLPAAAFLDKPQIDPNNNKIIWGLSGTSFCSADATVPATAVTVEALANCQASLPRLNPAGTKVAYSKTGESTGVYLLDLATKTETKIL